MSEINTALSRPVTQIAKLQITNVYVYSTQFRFHISYTVSPSLYCAVLGIWEHCH